VVWHGRLVRHAWRLVAIGLALIPTRAAAGNEEVVVAGTDVAVSGGAVVAQASGGAALWYNPAGVASRDERSVGFTGALISYRIARAPGVLSLGTGERSNGKFSSVDAIPRAATVVGAPRPNLRFAVGLFYTQTFDRALQDAVSGPSGAAEPTRLYASNLRRDSIYHAAAAVAWRRGPGFRLGGGVDAVVFTSRRSESIVGSYMEDAGGSLSRSNNQSFFGAGLQLKLGLQWRPSQHLRVGWMASTPSVLFFLDERSTRSRLVAPAAGNPATELSQVDRLRPTFRGVEPALSRAGVAYEDDWGWVEVDTVVRFPLRTRVLDVNRRLTTNVHVGGMYQVRPRVKVGAGLFTDFSPNRDLDAFGDEVTDYYGASLGADVSNRGKLPLIQGRRVFFTVAFAARYAYGIGEIVGLRLPTELGTSPDPVALPTPVALRVHDLGLNLAFKAEF
jgi:hypothetical protein